MIRNGAGQSIGAQMIDATAGAAFTGTVTVYVTGDAGTQALGSVGSGICTHEGNGYHTYKPATAETDYLLIAFTFIGAGAIPQTIQVTTVTTSQQSALQTATGSSAVAIQTLLEEALQEIGVLGAEETGDPADVSFALRKLNRLLDDWNAIREAVYGELFTSYTLTPNLQPHTIGPNSATFTVTQRPVDLLGANLILTNVTPNVRTPITLRDSDWWGDLAVLDLTSSIPTDCYYSPAWPNGAIYLWPIPTAAYHLELQTRVLLNAVTLADTFWLPPGYRNAITLTLAEALAPAFHATLTQGTIQQASQARARIFANNDQTPRLTTLDAGMPGATGQSTFNYRSRSFG